MLLMHVVEEYFDQDNILKRNKITVEWSIGMTLNAMAVS